MNTEGTNYIKVTSPSPSLYLRDFVFALGLFHLLQAEREQELRAQTVRQEQPFITCGPTVRPEN